ncbi:MAG: UDP-N-acetylmuramoyl-L-alanyl-D-glutamate--2,6-diaminopimelate ligase [Elusimicrobia bacterium]|nr:UDP-N-acetylmuramoyl-L-alanyl-D-glutamate--2,6-diaminopimelate ligase [Elusimicrobiota bacterium]
MILDKNFFKRINANLINAESVEVLGVSYDSRTVKKGDVFFALSGTRTDGKKYIEDALSKGAVAVVLEGATDPLEAPTIICVDATTLMAKLARCVYDYPDTQMTVIGVTGTNGKTTVTYLIESILNFNNIPSGVMGTINYRYPGKIVDAANTTPKSADIYKIMREMLNAGVKHIVMEVSSHALELGRVMGIEFDIAVFTNLTEEHLDFHGTMGNYFNAKSKLFTGLLGQGAQKGKKYAIINVDDTWGLKLSKINLNADILAYSVRTDVAYKAEDVKIVPTGTTFTLVNGDKHLDVSMRQIGLHNVYNALAAVAAVNASGVELEKCVAALETASGAPGRLEKVDTLGLGFEILVDYAHTEDALKNVISAIKRLKPKRIITVFGCGGDRDRKKRPLMGQAVVNGSDFVFVTSDNPRTEDPVKITLDIEVGIKRLGKNNYKVVTDRAQAIYEAVAMAERGDIILLAGKGHETYQIIGTHKHYFNDCETAFECVGRVKESRAPKQHQKEFNF